MIYAFEDCELDAGRIVLRRGREEQRIEPQVFDLLAYLIAQRGRDPAMRRLILSNTNEKFISGGSALFGPR